MVKRKITTALAALLTMGMIVTSVPADVLAAEEKADALEIEEVEAVETEESLGAEEVETVETEDVQGQVLDLEGNPVDPEILAGIQDEWMQEHNLVPLRESNLPINFDDGRNMMLAGTPAEFPAGISADRFNVQEKLNLPPIRDQANWGTCWAFSTILLTESDAIRRMKVDKNAIDLSEWHLGSYANIYDATGELSADRGSWVTTDYQKAGWPSVGGNLEQGANTLMCWRGAADESVQGYPKSYENPIQGKYDDVYHISGYGIVNLKEPESVKNAILQYGAVSYMYESADKIYYNYANDAYYDDGKSFELLSGIRACNHGTAIVGWDDNYPASNFGGRYAVKVNGTSATIVPEDKSKAAFDECVAQGCKVYNRPVPARNGAWLIRNSWGDYNKSDGYFWVSYENQIVEDEEYYVLSSPKDDYDHVYQYDNAPYSSLLSVRSHVVDEAAIYKVQYNDGLAERLSAVAFCWLDAAADYSIQLYGFNPGRFDAESSKPTDGIELLKQPITGKVGVPGYQQIKIPETVNLAEGSTVAIVISFESGQVQTIPVEDSTVNSSVSGFNAGVYFSSTKETDGQPGQNYLAGGDDEWLDVNKDVPVVSAQNLRIKAYTDDTNVIPAPYEEKDFKITLKSSANGKISASKTKANIGEKITIKARPDVGYDFFNWTVESGNAVIENVTARETTFVVRGDVTISARFTQNIKSKSYLVKFNGNGATSGNMNNKMVKLGKSFKLTKNRYKKKGYTFNGWNTNKSGKGKKFKNQAKVKNLTSKSNKIVTLYAQWKPNTYTIKFNANGGKGKMSAIKSVKYGKNVKLPANKFKKSGKKFAGWSTSKSGKGTVYKNKSKVKNLVTKNKGSITLYAIWK